MDAKDVDIAKVRMGPNDILIVTINCPDSQFNEYAQKLSTELLKIKSLDHSRVFLVSTSVKFSVLSPDSPEYKCIVGDRK